MTLFNQGLLITAIGMGLVFVMIFALWGIMALLVKLTNKPEAEEEPGSIELPATKLRQPRTQMSSGCRDCRCLGARGSGKRLRIQTQPANPQRKRLAERRKNPTTVHKHNQRTKQMKVTITIEGKQYQVSIDDLNTRPILAEVDGKVYEVWPEDADSPVASAPQPHKLPHQPAQLRLLPQRSKTLTAPLPGVIISVEVREGQTVKTGQELYVLEAMKMKNSILADRDGKIAAIHISAGDQVSHNQPVMTFEG